MKKTLLIIFCILLFLPLFGCSLQNPDDMQMDVYMGTSMDLKLLHVNDSRPNRKEQIQGIYQAITSAEPTTKSMELFAFYPDYTLVIDDLENPGSKLTVVLDINYDRIEFYYPGPNPASSDTIYLSDMSVKEFKSYLHRE